MSKSREFDNVLDACLERLLVDGETVERCLQSFPQYADELKPLLETVLATRQASAIQPRLEFKDRARYQFYSALQTMEPRKRYLSFGWQPQWAVSVAVVLALLLTGGGTVAAAAGSMPDGPLYPVKLVTEQVWLVLTPSALGKVELYAEMADRRVLEIVRMTDESKPQHIERTARRLDTYLNKIAVLSSPEPAVAGVAMAPVVKQAPVAEVAPLTREALTASEAMRSEGAPLAREAPAPAVTGASLPSERAWGGRGYSSRLDKRAKLRVILMRHSVNHHDRLHALLQTAPPSARPALLRAIAMSEAGYEKALKSLD